MCSWPESAPSERRARDCERLGDVDVEAPRLLLVDRRGDVLPVVAERPGDLLGRGDRDQRPLGHQVERGEEVRRVDLIPVLGRQLGRRGQLHPLGVAERALGEDREPAQRLDLVAEQLDPDRPLLGRRVDVEDPAADGELAALLDLVDPLVAGVGEQHGDVLEVDLSPLCSARASGRSDGSGTVSASAIALATTTARGIGEGVQRGDPQAGEVRRRIEVGLEGRPARGIEVDRPRGEERPEVRGQVAGRAVVRGDDQDRPGPRAVGDSTSAASR